VETAFFREWGRFFKLRIDAANCGLSFHFRLTGPKSANVSGESMPNRPEAGKSRLRPGKLCYPLPFFKAKRDAGVCATLRK